MSKIDYYKLAEECFYNDMIEDSIKYYKLSLENGCIAAAYELGIIYKEIEPINLLESIKYLKIGFDNEHEDSIIEFSNTIIEIANSNCFIDNLEKILIYKKYQNKALIKRLINEIDNIKDSAQCEKIIRIFENNYQFFDAELRMKLPEYVVKMFKKYIDLSFKQCYTLESMVFLLKKIKKQNQITEFNQVNKYSFEVNKIYDELKRNFKCHLNSCENINEFNNFISQVESVLDIEQLYMEFFEKMIFDVPIDKFNEFILDLHNSNDETILKIYYKTINKIKDIFTIKVEMSNDIYDVSIIIDKIDASNIAEKFLNIREDAIKKIESIYLEQINLIDNLEDLINAKDSICNNKYIKNKNLLKEACDLKYNDDCIIFNKILNEINNMKDTNLYFEIKNNIKELEFSFDDNGNNYSELLMEELDYKMFMLLLNGNNINFNIKEFYHNEDAFNVELYKRFNNNFINKNYVEAYKYISILSKKSKEFYKCENIFYNLLTQKDCPKFDLYNYGDEFSNFLYCTKFKIYENYDKVNINYLLKRYLIEDKKSYNLLFLGCGNYKEIVIALDWFCDHNLTHKNINITIIDQYEWKYNFSEDVAEKLRLFESCNIYFIEGNYFNSFGTNLIRFNSYDLVYFSRCINPLECAKNHIYNNYFQCVSNLIDGFDNAVLAFSQVVNFNNQNAIICENELRRFLKEHYKIKMLKVIKNLQEEIILYNMSDSHESGEPLKYYLYIIEGDNCNSS